MLFGDSRANQNYIRRKYMTELLIFAGVIAFILLGVICLFLIRISNHTKTVITCATKKELKQILKSIK